MRCIINYIRECFCKHEFVYDEAKWELTTHYGSVKQNVKVSSTCKKCGYHKSYFKFKK